MYEYKQPINSPTRMAFGRGWEQHRIDTPRESNPFEIGTFQYDQWNDGWDGFEPMSGSGVIPVPED